MLFRGRTWRTASVCYSEAEETAPLHPRATISHSFMKQFFAYITSNKSRRLYIGMSSDLPERVRRHKLKIYPDSFTARYRFDTLVWYEDHPNFRSARAREVELKGWRREKKLALILAENPDWADPSLR